MKTITLRQLEPGDDFQDSDLVGPARSIGKTDGSLKRYREVSPIPEGYEVCDLADATKVWIGEVWLIRQPGGRLVSPAGFEFTLELVVLKDLGILAIRPIPEPEPMMGEARCEFVNSLHCIQLPISLIGETIRWEVVPKVKDGGENENIHVDSP